MKSVAIALLLVVALAGNVKWDLPDSLPSCYTTLPFSFSLAPGYTYKSVDIPAWAAINGKDGVITGKNDKAGAWPFTLSVADGKGNSINKQYILNVIDRNGADKDIWAVSSNSYYGRKVEKPFRIVASSGVSTAIQVG